MVIAVVAVGEVRRAAEHRGAAGLLVPAHHAVVRDVAPQQGLVVAEPDRAFRPPIAGRDAFDYRTVYAIALEAGIKDPHRRVGVAHRGAVPARLSQWGALHDLGRLRRWCSDRRADLLTPGGLRCVQRLVRTRNGGRHECPSGRPAALTHEHNWGGW